MTDRTSEPVVMEWQPIETAPKNGIEIILGGVDVVGAGFWHGNADDLRRAEPGWLWEGDRDNLLIAKNAFDITHWMPLPKPPEPVDKTSV